MIHENYFEDMFESTLDYRKIVLLIFLNKNDNDFIKECGFLKSDINCLTSELKNILMKQNEKYFAYVKNEEESIIETILNK